MLSLTTILALCVMAYCIAQYVTSHYNPSFPAAVPLCLATGLFRHSILTAIPGSLSSPTPQSSLISSPPLSAPPPSSTIATPNGQIAPNLLLAEHAAPLRTDTPRKFVRRPYFRRRCQHRTYRGSRPNCTQIVVASAPFSTSSLATQSWFSMLTLRPSRVSSRAARRTIRKVCLGSSALQAFVADPALMTAQRMRIDSELLWISTV